MIKIAICDDDKISLCAITELLKKMDGLDGSSSLVRAFSSSVELLELLSQGEAFDLFFLDVVMPEVDGISLGEYIYKNMKNAKIVYCSSTREFAVESYMVNAFYYMLKPICEVEFSKVFSRAMKSIQIEKDLPVYVPLDTTSGVVAVEIDRIEYCTLENRRVKYFLSDGLEIESKVIRGSFEDCVADVLANKKFFKCSSHCVINIDKVRSIESDRVIMRSGEGFKVSRVFRNELSTAYFDYYFENFGGRV